VHFHADLSTGWNTTFIFQLNVAQAPRRSIRKIELLRRHETSVHWAGTTFKPLRIHATMPAWR
jgi:hypothetical protein